MAVVYHLSIQDVIKKDNISSIQYFLCQCIKLFCQNIISPFLNFSQSLISSRIHEEDTVTSQGLEACYCNTADTRARPSSEIQAKYRIERANK